MNDYFYEPPEWINAEESIENLIESIRRTLQFWLDIHTRADAWANEWAMDGDWSILLEDGFEIENNYFSFDLKSACYGDMAEQYIGDFVRCEGCGSLWEVGYEDCDCEEDCTYEELTGTEDDLDELAEFFEMCETPVDEETIQRTMEEKGFEIYYDALEPVIRFVVEDIRETLGAYDEIDSNVDRLAWALEASGIMHIHGDICHDYGDRIGLEYDLVDKYRTGGLVAVFSEEEIKEYCEFDKVLEK